MRKIKITALLLAVLMIVTAFAGCASKSTVTNLDNKVNDLDDKIQDQAEALSSIESTLANISEALNNQSSSAELDDVKADIEENKKDIQDILAAIEGLKESLGVGEQGSTSDELKTAITQNQARLEVLAGKINDNKINYTAETLAAVREAIAKAAVDISASKTKEAAEAAYKAVEDKLAIKVANKDLLAVNDLLYAYVVELEGNITDATAELVEDAVEALEAAREHYELDANFRDYYISKNETIDLVTTIEKLKDDQTVKLPRVKDEAQKLDKLIDKIDGTYTFADVTEILAQYKVWERDAKALSPENVKLVKNYEKLLAAQTSALNTDTAKIVFQGATLPVTVAGDYFGFEAEIFADYLLLGEEDFGKVVYRYKTEKKFADGEYDETDALTSKVYDKIDAWVADWAEEYSLTELAVETIIDSVYSGTENFYAKYKADRALVKAFEAEAEKVNKDIFSNIKALNSKKLGADAVDVLNAFKKNAQDINAWRDALVAAYDLELKQDDEARANRNINTLALYKDALTANFNAMVEAAELKEEAYEYDFGFLKDIAKDEGANKAYYLNLYDFKNEDLVNFLTVTFKAAEEAAKAINNKIKNFNAEQAHSIKGVSVSIGGYVAPADENKLLVLDELGIKAALAANNGVPSTIAQFVYKYNTLVPYDLSSMIDVAAYEAKIAAVENNIKVADKAAADLDSAWGEFVEEDGSHLLVTLDEYNTISALYGLLQKWKQVGYTDMEVATVINTTPAGVKEYKFENILAPYSNITPELLVTTNVTSTTETADTGDIVKLYYRANQLKKEAALAVSAYEVLEKLSAFGGSNAFSFSNVQDATNASNVLAGLRSHFGYSGVVSVTCGDVMERDGKDAFGREYLKDQSLWTVEYVTLSTDPIFKTAKLEGYYYSNYENAVAAKNDLANATDKDGKTIQEALCEKMWLPSDATSLTLDEYVTEVMITIPEFVKNNDVIELAKRANTEDDLKDKVFVNYQLPMLAMSLEARFLVNNYLNGYDKLEAAKAKWDNFTYIKGITYAYMKNCPNTFPELDMNAINACGDVEALRRAVKAAVSDTGRNDFDASLVFGAADFSWMSNPFNVELRVYGGAKVDMDDYTVATGFDYEDDFNLTAEDFVVEGIVIYLVCDHSDIVEATCEGHQATCEECGVIVDGTADHKKPTGCDDCTSYNCTVCGEYFFAGHASDSKDDVVAVDVSMWVGAGEVNNALVTLKCDKCGDNYYEDIFGNEIDFTDNGSAGLSADDVVTFTIAIAETEYTVTATYDGSAWSYVIA